MKTTLSETTAADLDSWLSNLKEFELDNMFETRVLGRGYEYVKGIEVEELTTTHASARSVETNEYYLNLELDHGRIMGSCTCPHNQACKHLAAFLLCLSAKMTKMY